MKLRRIIGWGVLAIAAGLLVTGLVAYARSGNACDDPATAAPAIPMKAVVYCDYGSPDVLKLEAVERPVPNDTQVLVRVRAASLNPLDWHYMRGTPYIGRLGMGLRKPATTRLGVDFAGTVEAVGKRVTQFKPGDEVFGGRTGALAEYVIVRENGPIALKPANMTFEQAAAVPVSALTALQGLRDEGKVQPGQKVLINGASGGVGTFAVQIAKALGADVTGVCSTRNVDMVRSLGADRVIDYTKENFTNDARRYDVVLDNVGNHSLSDLRRVMTPHGKYVMVGGPSGRWLAPLPRAFAALVVSRFVSQDMTTFLAELDPADLAVIRGLIEAGKVTPVIDRRYRLSDVGEAIGYLEAGHARGKVIVTMD